MNRILMALILSALAMLVASADTASSADAAADNAYLDGFQGEWEMIGNVLGKAVRYHCQAQRVLQGGFLSLHMIDAAPSPEYEAEVFIGFDATARDYIVHWLDRYGAAGARVVATGKRKGQRLVVTFPYSSGAFRDTFSGDPKSNHWTLLIESQKQDGGWSTFGSYDVTRR
jgi:hypothetical protein